MNHIALECSTPTVSVGTNHYIVCDISGSMYSTLPKMRQHLKNRMALLVKPEDTVTVIYFSGKGQAGVVFENVAVNTVGDLTAVNTAIDKFLQPCGLTAFVDPIKLAKQCRSRINNGNLHSLSFLTDGYDNCYSSREILNEVCDINQYFDQFTLLEYGWYCNRDLLSKIAQQTGAIHVFSEDYLCLEPAIENVLQKKSFKLREVNVVGESVLFRSGDDIVQVDVINGKVKIPEDISDIYVMSADADVDSISDEESLLMTLYWAVTNNKASIAWTVLSSIGDQSLYNSYQNCFTKQDYSLLTSTIKAVISGDQVVSHDGISEMDTSSVLDVLSILSSGQNFIDTTHIDFKYNKIGRSTKQKEDTVVQDLTSQMQSLTDIKDMQAVAMQIVSHETFNPEFVSTDGGLKSLDALVFNETRPNISIQSREQGYVSIPEGKQKEWGLPKSIDTSIIRNFTVVKDGIVNLKKLPVVIDTETHYKLEQLGYINEPYVANRVYVLDLSTTPLMSYKLVYDRELSDYAQTALELQDLKAQQKVIKYLRDQNVDTRVSTSFAEYGEEAAKWLYEVGIRDYGFTPPVAQVDKTGDFYISKELSVKIKSLSSLPSIAAVQKKVKEGKKLNIADALINKWLEFYGDVDFDFIKETKSVVAETRALQTEMNKAMYSILVGKSWFKGYDLDNASIDVEYEGCKTTVTVVVEEKEIKL